MESINRERFEKLLMFVSSHVNGKFTFLNEAGKSYNAVFDSVYDSDNSFDKEEEQYEDYKCISFKDISNGILFEINYRKMPAKAFCNGEKIY